MYNIQSADEQSRPGLTLKNNFTMRNILTVFNDIVR